MDIWISAGLVLVGIAVGVAFGVAYAWQRVATIRAEEGTRRAGIEANLGHREEQIAGLQTRLRDADASEEVSRREIGELQRQWTDLQARREEVERATEEKQSLLTRAEENLKDAFTALSSNALKSNNQAFLELARGSLEKFQESAKSDLGQRQEAIEGMVKPLRESLVKVDQSINELEKKRSEAYGGLSEQIKSLLESQQMLQSETGNLVKALRAPQVRGKWGEIQLKRTVEMAGMIDHVDFLEQESVQGEDGGQRPDMVITLPSGRQVVVDAKAPLSAYLDALEAKEVESQIRFQQQHARQIRDHLKKLGAKSYWKQFESTPEFVVLFLPGEVFFSAALEQDPGLIEYGVDQRVILATPTTLIALLKAVAYGWKQEAVAREARQISEQGRLVYERLAVLADHFGKLGASLGRAVKVYNEAVRSTETRLLPAARRLRELHAAGSREVEPIPTIQEQPDPPRLEELVGDDSAESETPRSPAGNGTGDA